VINVLKLIDRRILIGFGVILLVAVMVNVFWSPRESKAVTAHFSRAVSVYPGTDVRILGVNVGRVTAVIPQGDSVRVEMEYDASYNVPADASAVVVTPTLVADRFIQLTPVYTGGEVMADGAVISLPETGVPVELDRIYASLSALTQALGPDGVNADGTLNNLLAAAAEALDGQGAAGNEMITNLAAAAEVFGEGSGPLFETVTHLAGFTETLAENDELVRAFMDDLTTVAQVLAEESDELDKALTALARAVGEVESFVADNRDALVTDIEQLTDVLHTIASEEENLRTALEVAPVALGNLHASFDNLTGTQNARFGIGGNIWAADGFICGLVQQIPGMPRALKDAACALFKALLEPITHSIPFIPPEYGSNVPRGTADGGAGEPETVPVEMELGESPSVAELLGGGA
jgi:virulence factor Mce-like protein